MVQVEVFDPSDTRGFTLGSRNAGMRNVSGSVYQTTPETDTQGWEEQRSEGWRT